jgi:hypothetical protein
VSAHRFTALVRLVALGLSVALAAAPALAWAFESPNSPSSTELVEQPSRYNGTVISFKGEAIGEAMVRGSDAWIHLNDDAYMNRNVEEGAPLDGFNSGMPVWLPAPQAEKIGIFGDYKHEGDVVTVSGTFNAACAQHGGDMDIHATELQVDAPGHGAQDPIPRWKLVLAGCLTLAVLLLWAANRRAGRLERLGLPFLR